MKSVGTGIVHRTGYTMTEGNGSFMRVKSDRLHNLLSKSKYKHLFKSIKKYI